MNMLNAITDPCCDKPQVESPNLLETFKRKRARLQTQIEDTDAVIAALEAHPEINKLLELIAKAR